MRATIEELIFKNITSIALVILFGLPILVFLLIGYKKLFNKCKENGWQAFVPIYNTYILGEIAKVHWIYSILANSFFIAQTLEFYKYEIILLIISLVGRFIINYNIAKLFNKDYNYVVIMTILPLPTYALLGYNKTKPNFRIKLSKNGPLDSPSLITNIPSITEPTTNSNKVKPYNKEELLKIKKEISKETPSKKQDIKEPIDNKKKNNKNINNNTYEIPIINVSFDKDSIPNTKTKKEEKKKEPILSDDELLESIIKKRKEKKPRPRISAKNKRKKAVKRLKQRKKNK